MPMTDDDVTIRPARREEREGVITLAWWLIADTPYADPELLGGATRASIGAVVDHVLDAGERGVILVAEAGDDLVGFLAVLDLVHPMTGQHIADELGWWVVPERQRQHIGLALLRRAEAWARDRGLTTLRLSAPVGTALVRLYGALGYRPVEIAYCVSLSGDGNWPPRVQ
jgi:GNAT superfamily N-acetyltransferase